MHNIRNKDRDGTRTQTASQLNGPNVTYTHTHTTVYMHATDTLNGRPLAKNTQLQGNLALKHNNNICSRAPKHLVSLYLNQVLSIGGAGLMIFEKQERKN